MINFKFKISERYGARVMQNAECKMQNYRGSFASEYYIASLTKSNAKPYLPLPREGDHAFGVVVGSSLTVILQFVRTMVVQKVYE